jgi:hypothetical protein
MALGRPRHCPRKKKGAQYAIDCGSDVQEAGDVEHDVHDVRRPGLERVPADEEGGREEREHEAEDGVDDAVLARRVELHLECHQHCKHSRDGEEHAPPDLCVYT